MKTFILTLNEVNVCDLFFDEAGKYKVSFSDIVDVHQFCRTVIQIIDDLPDSVVLTSSSLLKEGNANSQ